MTPKESWQIIGPEGRRLVVDHNHAVIAQIWGGESHEARARLIVASPGNLNTLIDSRDFVYRTLKWGEVDTDSRVDLTEALRRIDNAIAASVSDWEPDTID